MLSEGSSEADKENTWDEWTKEELEAGKPLLVYYFVDGLMDATNDNYDLSQAFEVKVLTKDDIVEEINENWRARKAPLDGEGDAKKLENQARIEFYAFTGEKMGDITIKDKLSSRKMKTSLKKYRAKNAKYVKAELKRLEAADKEQARAE